MSISPGTFSNSYVTASLRGGIVESGHDMFVAHPESGCVGRRIETYRPRPQPGGLLGDHQAQLPSAYDSYGLHPSLKSVDGYSSSVASTALV